MVSPSSIANRSSLNTLFDSASKMMWWKTAKSECLSSSSMIRNLHKLLCKSNGLVKNSMTDSSLILVLKIICGLFPLTKYGTSYSSLTHIPKIGWTFIISSKAVLILAVSYFLGISIANGMRYEFTLPLAAISRYTFNCDSFKGHPDSNEKIFKSYVISFMFLAIA